MGGNLWNKNNWTKNGWNQDKLLKEFLKEAHLDLVVSVDLKGATKKKMRVGDVKPEWLYDVTEFYRTFPEELKLAYKNVPRYAREDRFATKKRLEEFKYLGDEILLRVTLDRHENSIFHVQAVKQAIKEYNRHAQKRGALECKGTGWICGFPVTDYEVCPGEHANQKKMLLAQDVIGPSMDLGFRIAKFARPRKLVISTSLAMMLIRSLNTGGINLDCDSSELVVFFERKEPLKGVLHETPYPIIWINIKGTEEALQDKLRGYDRRPCELPDLLKFCEEFETSAGLEEWFIKGDQSKHYRGPNKEWRKRYLDLCAQREKIIKRSKTR